ncbi:MAG TPA: hypothetical protein VGI40_11145 [Pirellulaceae bacterium]
MTTTPENTASASAAPEKATRTHWYIVHGQLGDQTLESVAASTPEQRLSLIWPLTIQAWAFKGIDVAESRLPRHLMRITRRER